jgi:hypothetical protein
LSGSATAVWNGKADFFIGDGSAYVEWAFPGPQNGFGGTFSFPQDPSGSFALSFEANDSVLGWIDVCANCVLEGYSGFFGFTSASPFNGVRIFGPGSYTMTDVSVGAVPLPAAVWLFASALGLAGVGFHRRRQQS